MEVRTPVKPLRLPPWIRVHVHVGNNRDAVSRTVNDQHLNTVCRSAKCPNIGECWHRGSATFMILGNRCTRACGFCAIQSFKPEPVDMDEPERVAESASRLNLKYVVVTSVNRDDLPDKGADHFVQTIKALRRRLPGTGIEVLTPDFKGKKALIEQVMNMRPHVYNHNMETCDRLTPLIRSGGKYERSLSVLRIAKELSSGHTAVKSGIMVGLGESDHEIEATMMDMRKAGVDILTIGQYLPPSGYHWLLDRYVKPERFAYWAELAKRMGFKAVASSPMVRSSYKADELAKQVLKIDAFHN
jgi:lipoyl synthase